MYPSVPSGCTDALSWLLQQVVAKFGEFVATPPTIDHYEVSLQA